MNGTSLTITFDETLAAAASLANEAFGVRKTLHNGTRVTAALSGSPAISGATLTLTLAEAVLYSERNVTVSYARPPTGSANRLVDAAGNETRSFTDQAVTNSAPVPSAPCTASSSPHVGPQHFTVTTNTTVGTGQAFIGVSYSDEGVGSNLFQLCKAGSATVTEANRGNNTTHVFHNLAADTDHWVRIRESNLPKASVWKHIRTLPTSRAPARPAAPMVSGASASSLSVSWAAPTDLGSASSIGDYDLRYFAGTSDPANEADWIEEGETDGPPDPGTSTSATIAGLTSSTTYRVQVRAFGDLESPWSASGNATTKMTPQSAGVDAETGKTLTLTFDKALAAPDAAVLERLRFAFALHGFYYQGGLIRAMGPDAVAVDGRTVTLTVGHAAPLGREVKVSYDGSEPILRGLDGNTVESFSAVAKRAGSGPALLEAAQVEGTALALTFDKALDGTSSPAGSRFLVMHGYRNVLDSPSSVVRGTGTASVSGKRVTVTLPAGIVPDGASAQDVWANLSYERGADASPLREASGGTNVGDIRYFPVTVLDQGAPATVSGVVAGATATVYFNEALDAGAVPRKEAFTLGVNGTDVPLAVGAVAVEDTAVVLTLASAVGVTDTATLAYERPAADPIRDLAGNESGDFAIALMNQGFADPAKPALAATNAAAVAGDVLTLTFDRDLDAEHVPGAEAFSLSYAWKSVESVAVRDAKVELSLSERVYPCNGGFTVSYAKPDADALRSVWGTEADGVLGQGGRVLGGRDVPARLAGPNQARQHRHRSQAAVRDGRGAAGVVVHGVGVGRAGNGHRRGVRPGRRACAAAHLEPRVRRRRDGDSVLPAPAGRARAVGRGRQPARGPRGRGGGDRGVGGTGSGRRRGDLGRGHQRHLRARRAGAGNGDVRRDGGRGHDRGHAPAHHRPRPGGLGREARGLRERQRYPGARVCARGGGAEHLDGGHRGARGHAGAEWWDHQVGGDANRRCARPRGSRARRRPQGGLAPGALGGGCASARGRGGRVRGASEPHLHGRGAPGDGGLRDSRRPRRGRERTTRPRPGRSPSLRARRRRRYRCRRLPTARERTTRRSRCRLRMRRAR